MRGGLRTRLIMDSARITILAGLAELGWFDPTVYDTPPGLRRHRPFRYVTRPALWTETTEPNALTINPETITDDDLAFGGEVEDTIRVYVDLFAQDDAFGWQVSRDIEDIALGNLPDIGRTGPVIDVYDVRLATPAPFTQLDVERVVIDRAAGRQSFQEHWFMIRIDVTDEYPDEYTTIDDALPWSPDFAAAWQRVQAA